MKNKIIPFIIPLLALLLWVPNALAQDDPRQEDPFFQFFYPPELIMQNQSKVALSEKQKEDILSLVETSQSKFNRLHWDLQTEMEAFKEALQKEQVQEELALDHLDKILTLERQIKKTQISLMIRIKNLLSPEQKQQLDALK